MGLNTNYFDREQECEWHFRNSDGFWHICTQGEDQCVIFCDDDSYRYAITAMGITATEHADVGILAYAIMSNHVHMILEGSREHAEEFFTEWRSKVKKHLGRHHDGVRWDGIEAEEVIEITDLRMLRTEIAYCNRNGFVEGACPTPFAYRWGSGRFYFSLPQDAGIPYSSLGYNSRRRLIHARAQALPEHFNVLDGMIDPRSFCEFGKGMSFFTSGQTYFAEISRNFEAFSLVAGRLRDRIFLTDSELYPAMLQLCRQKYNKKKVSELSPDERIETARELHDKFNASNAQIARVLNISKRIVDELYPTSAKRKV